jgi:hypothetical protein
MRNEQIIKKTTKIRVTIDRSFRMLSAEKENHRKSMVCLYESFGDEVLNRSLLLFYMKILPQQDFQQYFLQQ